MIRRLMAGPLVLLLLGSAPLSAQIFPRMGIYAGGMALRVRSDMADRAESMNDYVFAGDAWYSHGPLVVDELELHGYIEP